MYWWSLFITHPPPTFVSLLYYCLGRHSKHKLCNPCDQGRVDIIIEHMFLFAGNKLTEFISSLSLYPPYMLATRAQLTKTSVGFGIACFIWDCLLAWYINQWIGIRRHGKTEVSLTNSASCSMHHVLRERCCILYGAHWPFPWVSLDAYR